MVWFYFLFLLFIRGVVSGSIFNGKREVEVVRLSLFLFEIVDIFLLLLLIVWGKLIKEGFVGRLVFLIWFLIVWVNDCVENWVEFSGICCGKGKFILDVIKGGWLIFWIKLLFWVVGVCVIFCGGIKFVGVEGILERLVELIWFVIEMLLVEGKGLIVGNCWEIIFWVIDFIFCGWGGIVNKVFWGVMINCWGRFEVLVWIFWWRFVVWVGGIICEDGGVFCWIIEGVIWVGGCFIVVGMFVCWLIFVIWLSVGIVDIVVWVWLIVWLDVFVGCVWIVVGCIGSWIFCGWVIGIIVVFVFIFVELGCSEDIVVWRIGCCCIYFEVGFWVIDLLRFGVICGEIVGCCCLYCNCWGGVFGRGVCSGGVVWEYGSWGWVKLEMEGCWFKVEVILTILIGDGWILVVVLIVVCRGIGWRFCFCW